MTTAPQFDTACFLAQLDNDRELARELLDAFLEDAPARLAQLEQAVAAQNADAATRAAHSLKGMCGVLKDETLISLALGLEMSARKRDFEALTAGLPALSEALRAVMERITASLSTL